MASSANVTAAGLVYATGKHSSHPDFGHLILLVLEAVLEVVCVSLPGYIVARRGLFDADAQKMVANLNVQLFTPCLIFSKLAAQLTADRLLELMVIPVIFIVQTLVSWLCAKIMSKMFRLPKAESNFVTAMGVFGNSNSLPISLIISLSKTLSGLHWDKRPGDNDNEVAARGILYLLVFQQLGQVLRWSWGYNVLLKPVEKEEQEAVEEGRYHDDSSSTHSAENDIDNKNKNTMYHSDYASGSSGAQSPHTVSSVGSSSSLTARQHHKGDTVVAPGNANVQNDLPVRGGLDRHPSANHITRFPSFRDLSGQSVGNDEENQKSFIARVGAMLSQTQAAIRSHIAAAFSSAFHILPQSMQNALSTAYRHIAKFASTIYGSMNPPLWAMLAAIIVATVPQFQAFFFTKGTFVNNSVTHAVTQSGQVAVPLILVVLGANLARNTLPQEQVATTRAEKRSEAKLLYAALIARMLLPLIFMGPFLALFARYVPVSILDDPIFVIVCFLLVGAPSALQLAQICQLNNVFVGVMSRLLFQSYVVWILPSTLILVMAALETVEWAAAA